MKIGFTGSSTYVSSLQELALISLLTYFLSSDQIEEGHHGDCVIGDSVFHEACLTLNVPLVGHPPIDAKKRAYNTGFKEIRESKYYLTRNKDIVTETDFLIAILDSYLELLRSGTWSTIREARKQKKDIYLIMPNGVIEFEKKGDKNHPESTTNFLLTLKEGK